MPDELALFTFRFNGTIPTKRVPLANLPPNTTEADAPAFAEGLAVQELNAKANELAGNVERMLERVLAPGVPPPVAVQAELRFHVGRSIELAGTVLLSVAVAAGAAIQKELAYAVESVVKRVVNDALTPLVQAVVSAVGGVIASLTVRPSSAQLSPPPATTQVATASHPAAAPPSWLALGASAGVAGCFILLNAALLTAALVLLVLITMPAAFSLRSPSSVPAPAATLAPAALTPSPAPTRAP